MEVLIVRLVKIIIAIVVLNMFLSNTPAAVLRPTASQSEANRGGTRQQDAGAKSADPNNLAEYYGFGEMEIVKLDWDIGDLRIADFNGDGKNDIAIVNDRKARIELLIQKEAVEPGEAPVAVDLNDIDINIINPPSRFQKEYVAVSQKIFSFVCGDLNSDKMMDLAFYGEPKGLYVILQKAGEKEAGKPKTLSWRTRKKIKIDDGLVTSHVLACADLNNDGADDLALAGRDGVYIILQKKDGSLAEPVKYPTTALTLAVEVGDLNGDKINDLILVTNDSEKPIHVRFGLETGQLGPQVQFFIERPIALELKDIDGDGRDEILTIDAISKRLMCYKLATEKEADSDWPSLFYPLTSGEGSTKRDLVVGDFDGDGLEDVAISDPGAAEIILYKQTAKLGLAEPVKFPAFADIDSLSAADIDNDKKDEIAVLSVKEKIIGMAEFKDDRLSFPKPIETIGEPVAMDLADVDHDGKIDCLYISKDVNDIRHLRVIYNLGATDKYGNRSKNKRPKDTEEAKEDSSALELKGLVSDPDGMKILDVDQDGLEDVLIFVKYELPVLVRQVQKKQFEVVDSPSAQTSLIKDAALGSVGVANVDGKNGEELLVAQNNFARSLVFAEGKNWSIIDQYNAKDKENKISSVAAFDIDGGGPQSHPAILLLDGQKGELQILKTDADNTYRFEKELNVDTWNAAAKHLKMLFAPLTGSKTKSILLFDGDKFALITPPSGSFSPRHLEQLFSYETKIKDGMYGKLTTGDINGDGRVDIIMVEYRHNHVEILALDKDMKPIPAMRFKIFEQKSYRDSKEQAKLSVEPREMQIADVTGDGKNDLVTVIHDRIIIYPQD
jgi:hypothetical protein